MHARSIRIVVLASALVGIALPVAFAADVDVDDFAKLDPSRQIAALNTEAFWRSFSEECGTAYHVGFGPPEAAPARERAAKLREFKQCAIEYRARLEAAAARSTDKSRPIAQVQADTVTHPILEQTDALAAEAAAQETFLGLRFGVGVGVSYSMDDVVSEAALDPSGVIVATKTQTQLPRVILESHYYGWCKSASCNAGKFGVGPYFGIVAKSDKLISAFSAGAMVGWKDKKGDDHQGFSIGFGALLDDAVTSLADGFDAGQPLPPGETTIRYEEKARWSVILFFTRTF